MVAVKRFPENTYFLKMLISGKGKCFHVFGCISKNFPKNIFWCLEKKKENTNQKTQATTQEKKNHQFQKCFQSDDRAVIAIQDRDHGAIAIRDRDHGAIAIRDRDQQRDRDRWRDRDLVVYRAVGLELELAISDWIFSSRARSLSLSLSLSLFSEVN